MLVARLMMQAQGLDMRKVAPVGERYQRSIAVAGPFPAGDQENDTGSSSRQQRAKPHEQFSEGEVSDDAGPTADMPIAYHTS